jgi:hypothetical protein
MQLDRVPVRRDVSDSGTTYSPIGVETVNATPAERHPVPLWAWAALALVLFGVLGQGERSEVDPRFQSPVATLWTYWEALRDNDGATAQACLAGGQGDVPYPGMVWFLPATKTLALSDLHALPVERQRVMLTYEVRYRPRGLSEELSVRMTSELVRSRGEWHIVQPSGNASFPEWRPLPRSAAI